MSLKQRAWFHGPGRLVAFGVNGVISLLFGVALFFNSGMAHATLIMRLRRFALISGALLLAFAFNVKGWRAVLFSRRRGSEPRLDNTARLNGCCPRGAVRLHGHTDNQLARSAPQLLAALSARLLVAHVMARRRRLAASSSALHRDRQPMCLRIDDIGFRQFAALETRDLRHEAIASACGASMPVDSVSFTFEPSVASRVVRPSAVSDDHHRLGGDDGHAFWRCHDVAHRVASPLHLFSASRPATTPISKAASATTAASAATEASSTAPTTSATIAAPVRARHHLREATEAHHSVAC